MSRLLERGSCRFGVLGSLCAWQESGAEMELGWPKQRLVLAALLCSPNRAVSTDRLADLVRPGQPIERARGSVQVYISRLRAVLGRERLLHNRGGYLVVVRPDELDVCRFEESIRAARAAMAGGRVADAAERFADSLALWRGDVPYADVSDAELIRSESARLTELRDSAVEEAAEARLALGETAELVPELWAQVTTHPLRERLRAALMLALDRSGRTADALQVYRDGREILVGELGVEPGPELRELHEAILQEDSSLAGPEQLTIRRSAVPVPRELPVGMRAFVGRDAELARLEPLLLASDGGPRIIHIYGPGGVGKSTFAIHVGHAISRSFPDGVLYAPLYGATPGTQPTEPSTVLGRFLRALGTPPSGVPVDPVEAAARFRSVTADKRLLVVLDDAAGPDQVRDLLPSGADCAAIVTGRTMLSTLDGAEALRLDDFNEAEAVELLGRLVGDERVSAEPEAARRVVRHCWLRPLAIRVVGARTAARPVQRLDDLAYRLEAPIARLDEFEYGDLSVRSALDMSLESLDADDRRCFLLLGLLNLHHVTAPVLAAATGWDERRAAVSLERLAAATLTDALPGGRYVMHDLVRLYATDRAGGELTETEGRLALRAVGRWYLASARRTCSLLAPWIRRGLEVGVPSDRLQQCGVPLRSVEDAAAWLDDESINVPTLASQMTMAERMACERLDREIVLGLCAALQVPLTMRMCLTALRDLTRLGLVNAEAAGGPGDLARAHRNIGSYPFSLGPEESERHLLIALRFHRESGDNRNESAVLNDLAELAALGNHYTKAIELRREALEIHKRSGPRTRGVAVTLNNLATAYLEVGDVPKAIEVAAGCLKIRSELEDHRGEGLALNILGEAHRRSGQAHQAVSMHSRGIELLRLCGEQDRVPTLQWRLAAAYDDLGRSAEAQAVRGDALQALAQAGELAPGEWELLISQSRPDTPEAIRRRF